MTFSNLSRSKLSLAALLFVFGACGELKKFGDNPNNDPKPNNGQNTPTQECGVVYDIATLAKAGYTLPSVVGDYIVSPVGYESCDQTTTVNGVQSSTHYAGYSQIVARPKIVPVDQFKVQEPRGSNSRIVLTVINAPTLSSGDKADLAAKLGALQGRDIDKSIILQPAIGTGKKVWIVFSNGQSGSGRIVPTDKSEQAQIEITLNYGSEDVVARQLNDGTLSIEMYFEIKSYAGQSVFVKTDLIAQQRVVTASLKNGSTAKLLNALWANARNNDERSTVLTLSTSFQQDYPLANPKSELSSIYTTCEREWAPVPDTLTDISWSAATLQFLNTVDPQHPTKRLWTTFKQLAGRSFGSRSALGESHWLVYKSGLSEAEQEALIQIYGLVEESALPYGDQWSEAKEFARNSGYQVSAAKTLIARIKTVYDWAQNYSGPGLSQREALNKATDYVRNRTLSDLQFDLIRSVFAWLQSSSGPYLTSRSEALSKTEALVLEGALTQAQFTSLKSSFEWMTSSSGPYVTSKSDALAKTQELVLIKKMTSEQFLVLKSTFEWVTSSSGPYITSKSEAYSRSIDFVFGANRPTTEQFSLIKSVFAWLQSSSGPYVTSKSEALSKTEALVVDGGLSQAQFASLKSTFEWVTSSSGPYVTSKSDALAKTQDLVLAKSATGVQLATLKSAFQWLTSSSGPYVTSKSDAFAKVTTYVFDKQMSAQKLGDLKRAFEARMRSSSNRAAALAAAEAEVLNL
jgi:hypothetical protein